MDKMDSLSDYIKGNYFFLYYLIETSVGTPLSDELLADRTNLKAAKVGMISLLLQSIKEDIIELKDDEFLYKTLNSDINAAVNRVVTKKDDKYYVKDVPFDSAGDIINFFRKKMAHGAFLMDLPKNKVIFDKDGQEFSMNINLLTDFVIGLAKSYFSQVNVNSFSKPQYVFNFNPKERIENEYDVYKLIDNAKQIEYKLIRKDNDKIEDSVYRIVHESIKKFGETRHITELDNCVHFINTMYADDYEFSYKINDIPMTTQEKKTFAHAFCGSMRDFNYDNNRLVKLIGYELSLYISKDNTNFNAAKNALTLLILLQSIQQANTLDQIKLGEFINQRYGEILIIDYGCIASALISLFQAVFSYCKDNAFKNIDYKIFGFNGINTTLINTTCGETENLKLEIQGLQNNLNAMNEKLLELEKQRGHLIMAGKETPLGIVSSNITNLEGIRNNTKLKLNELNNILANRQELETPLYLYNKAVIEGIRNSIAHGNYKIITNPSLIESRIKFDDIYNDELTFSCDISFNDFFLSLANNMQVVNNVINLVKENPQLLLKKP